jgi:hypothetical protein
MASDPRLFFKLHNGFPEHPKAFELSDRAFRQLIEAWCYCSRNLNDGKLTKTAFFKLFSQKTRKEVLALRFVVETETGYEMHDYLEHQESAADVENRRIKRAEAGALGGKAKANNLASAKASASDLPKQTPSKPVADKDKDEDVDKELLKRSSSPATPDDAEPDPKPVMYSRAFEAFWDAYPRKVGKKAASAAFDKARKQTSLQAICQGAARYRDDPNREDAYTAHPTTWLNEGRWDDETPLPSRQAAQARPTGSDNRLNAGLARLAAYDANQPPRQLELGA